MDRFHDRIITKGYEQTFYEGVAEALGYPSNKQPFRTLAENVPLEDLKKIVPAKSAYEDKINLIQAVLFGVSGLSILPICRKANLPKTGLIFRT